MDGDVFSLRFRSELEMFTTEIECFDYMLIEEVLSDFCA